MPLSAFWNSPYRPSFTTTQITLRISTLLLSISCLAITIYLSLHFSLTYLIVYIALMLSILVSQISITSFISESSHPNFRAEHGILVGFEALVLAYWVIVFVLVKMGRGVLESEEIRWVDRVGREEGSKRERMYRWIHQGLIIGIITFHTLLITLCLISGYHSRRTLIQQRMQRKRKTSHINTFPPSRHTSSRPSPNTVYPRLLPSATATPKPTPNVTLSNLMQLGTISESAPTAATPATTSLRPTPRSTMSRHTPPERRSQGSR